MARQTGPNFFTGRHGDLQYYQMGAGHYVRVVSSLSASRVKQDPAFSLTMQYAGLLARAAKIASAVYRDLPGKEHGFYRKLTGMAMQLLKQGRTMEEAFQQLYDQFIPPPAPVVSVLKKKSGTGDSFPDNIFVASFADELLKRIFSTFPKDFPVACVPSRADPGIGWTCAPNPPMEEDSSRPKAPAAHFPLMILQADDFLIAGNLSAISFRRAAVNMPDSFALLREQVRTS